MLSARLVSVGVPALGPDVTGAGLFDRTTALGGKGFGKRTPNTGASDILRYVMDMSREPEKQPRWWVPHTDVFVTDAGMTILVELAGTRKEDLEVTVEGGRLRIQGDRPHPYPGNHAGTTHLVREIEFGNFETVLEVPQGYEIKKAKASYAAGFFRIEVPKQL